MSSIPATIGKYRVIHHLGEGGMGSVYLAHDDGIDRKVAIKLLRADDASLRRRFQTEAQSAGRLKHTNIVTVYEYGEFEDGPYLVMEYIEGRTIAQLIEQRDSMVVEDRIALLIQACQGLAYAHRCGVVHRDIKPSNLMVDRGGTLKIVDFGIARTSGKDLTMTGKVVGTPAYMSPEQIQGEQADQRSDTFALGLVAFEFLSGRCAYSGDSDYAIINRIVNGRPETFSHANPRLEALAAPVIAKALAREPNVRHQSADELAADLARVRSELNSTTPVPVAADTSTQPTKLLAVPRRPLWPKSAAAAIMVVAAGFGVRALWSANSAVDGNAVGAPPPDTPVVQQVQEARPVAGTKPESATPPPDAPTAPRVSPIPRPAPSAATPPVDARINARLVAAKTAEDTADYDVAIAGYQEILAADPRNSSAAEGLSSARRSQGRAREAEVKARIADGLQKLAEGAYDDAIATFEMVIKVDSNNMEALDGVARARKAKAAEEAILKTRAKRPPANR